MRRLQAILGNLRVLLASNASYLPPRGGSTRSNLAFLETLAERGRETRVVAAAAETHTEAQRRRLENELAEQRLDPGLARRLEREPAVTGFFNGIEILSVRDFMRHTALLTQQVSEFRPDWLLVSSEDVSHTLIREAARSAPGRLVYLAHTPQFFPFGEASWHPDREATEAIRRAAAVVVISRAMAAYVERHLGREATLIHPPIYKEPVLDRSESATSSALASGAIAMINPCAVKGISLFLALADSLPSEQFAVLPGWGTSAENLAHLKARRNITVWPRVRKIEEFLSTVKVLLVPSLWLEGFGLIVMEAMLCGVPVIASNSGGLPEAKAGTGFVIPVHLIESYEPVFDDRNMPRPLLPPQDIGPWLEALKTLMSSPDVYYVQRHAHREAAQNFVSRIQRFEFDQVLSGLSAAAPSHVSSSVSASAIPEIQLPRMADRLSDDRRALLLKRLRSRYGAGSRS